MRPGHWRTRLFVTMVTTGLVLVGVLGIVVPPGPEVLAGTDQQPWLAPGLSTEQRVNLLLDAMTVPDKIAELHADRCPPYEACIPDTGSCVGRTEITVQ